LELCHRLDDAFPDVLVLVIEDAPEGFACPTIADLSQGRGGMFSHEVRLILKGGYERIDRPRFAEPAERHARGRPHVDPMVSERLNQRFYRLRISDEPEGAGRLSANLNDLVSSHQAEQRLQRAARAQHAKRKDGGPNHMPMGVFQRGHQGLDGTLVAEFAQRRRGRRPDLGVVFRGQCFHQPVDIMPGLELVDVRPSEKPPQERQDSPPLGPKE
jgi:hypothetical protein